MTIGPTSSSGLRASAPAIPHMMETLDRRVRWGGRRRRHRSGDDTQLGQDVGIDGFEAFTKRPSPHPHLGPLTREGFCKLLVRAHPPQAPLCRQLSVDVWRGTTEDTPDWHTEHGSLPVHSAPSSDHQIGCRDEPWACDHPPEKRYRPVGRESCPELCTLGISSG